VYVSWQ